MSEKKKRICFCISDVSACGGTERVSLKVANELCNRDYDVHFVSLATTAKPFFDYHKKIRFHTLLKSTLDRKLIHQRWYKQWKLRRLLNKIKADIVIDTTLGNIISSTVLTGRERYILWVHFNYEVTAKYHPHLDTINDIIHRGGNMVVLTEKDREDYISHGVSAETISCISNPLTIEAAPAAVIRDKKVVSIGRFSPEKGFDLLLQAWAIVEKEDTEWKLEIWGDDGRYEHSLHQQLQDLDLKRATLHGTTKDVATLFNKSSIYVLSSRNESFGLVLLEASVCGLPLVAFDCPNGPGVIIGEGVNGTLVKPGDVPSLASALLDLMKNDKRRFEMGQNALKMSKRFTAERIVDQWEELFKRL